VDSSVPPPPSPAEHKLRPWYLIAAMVLTWFVGVLGMNEGFTIAAFLRGGTIPGSAGVSASAWTMADLKQIAALEQMRALLAYARLTFPLAVAETLLSALLVVASGLAMGGRRGARSLALQAIGANALLAALAFALTPAVRAAYIDGVLHAVEAVALPAADRALLVNPRAIQWLLRLKFVVYDLGSLALGALALTRARTKTYFDATARAAESADEP
jgi:hypothetical protein